MNQPDSTALPDPLVPAEVDLRGLAYMPLLGAKLFNSDFDLEASDAEFRRGLMLWWAAWNQQPAASLPNSDRSQAKLAGFEDEKSPTWRKVRKRALHGFILCSDGRLYHPIIAQQALIAWEKRGEEREERENEADRQRRSRADRKRMFADLRAVGVTLKWDIPMPDLRRIHAEHVTAAPPPDTPPDTPPVTVTGHGQASRPVTVTDTAKTGRDGTLQEEIESPPPTEVLVGAGGTVDPDPPEPPAPVPPPDPPPPAPPPPPAAPTAYAAITRALRNAGLSKAHPGNQRLRMLVDAGATEAEFLAMVPKALAEADDAFAYVLGAVEGERTRAKARADQLHRGPLPPMETAYQRTQRERMEEAVPSIAAKAPGTTQPNPMEVLDGLVRDTAG